MGTHPQVHMYEVARTDDPSDSLLRAHVKKIYQNKSLAVSCVPNGISAIHGEATLIDVAFITS